MQTDLNEGHTALCHTAVMSGDMGPCTTLTNSQGEHKSLLSFP